MYILRKHCYFIILVLISQLFLLPPLVNGQDSTWTQIDLPYESGRVEDVQFINELNGWAAGFDNTNGKGFILSSVDGGATWNPQNIDADGPLSSVFFLSDSLGFTAGQDWTNGAPQIFKTENGGESWIKQDLPVEHGWLKDIVIKSDSTGWAAGYDIDSSRALILKTVDDMSWSPCPNIDINASLTKLLFPFGMNGWALGNMMDEDVPIFLNSADGGENWTEVLCPAPTGFINDLFFLDSLIGWAAGTTNEVAALFKTEDGGESWSALPPPNIQFMDSTFTLAKQDATSAEGTILFKFMWIFFFSALLGIGMVNCILGDQAFSLLLRTTTGGLTWTILGAVLATSWIYSATLILNLIAPVLLAFGALGISPMIALMALFPFLFYLLAIIIFPKAITIVLGEYLILSALGKGLSFDKSMEKANTEIMEPEWSCNLGLLEPDGQSCKYTAVKAGIDTVICRDKISGIEGISIITVEDNSSVDSWTETKDFTLHQNWPNPFNPATNIKFEVKEAGNVQIIVYNLAGQKVKQLVSDHYQPGEYHIIFNGEDLPTGAYFYEIQMNGLKVSKRMVLVE